MAMVKWTDIIGHKQEIAYLRQMLGADRLPHALLFCGRQGVGKRQVALAAAAAFLCSESGDTACGACDSCLAMQKGIHPDIYFLQPESKGKAAKSIKLGQIKAMQEEIALLPVISTGRVVIMDDVEKMNEPAANSLLKTIEEPAGKVLFILLAGTASAVLPTVVSRCMRFDFGVLPLERLTEEVVRRTDVSDSQAAELAVLSGGSLGKALQLFQEGGLQLRDEAVAVLQGLPEMDMPAVWRLSSSLGQMEKEKLQQWLAYFNMLLRDLMFLYAGECPGSQLYNGDIKDKLIMLLPLFPTARILVMAKWVRQAELRVQANVNQVLLAESFLLRLGDFR